MISKKTNLSKVPLPTLCFDYQEKLLLALAPTCIDFSNDVLVSAAEVEDNNEVIENLSNLAFDKISGGDLLRLNPKVCFCARGLENSVG